MDADGVHLADLPVADLFARQSNGVRRPFVAAALDNPVVLLRCADDPPSFGDGIGQWLLAVDVRAGVEGGDGGQRVPVIGCGDGDGVEIAAADEVEVIPIRRAVQIGRASCRERV
jgi:hypothetical protein